MTEEVVKSSAREYHAQIFHFGSGVGDAVGSFEPFRSTLGQRIWQTSSKIFGLAMLFGAKNQVRKSFQMLDE